MTEKNTIPQEAVQELADKSAELARQGDEAPKANTTSIQINLEIVRKMKPYLAMPCYGGMLTESTFTSYIRWGHIAKQYGVEWSVDTMVNESLISRARNTLCAKFLETQDSTHLMFIDADIGFQDWHILAMLNRDVDVIGGLYPMKTLPIKWCVNGVENGHQTEDGLQEVSKTGTGFMLIKRDVLEKSKAHPSVKPYKNDIGLDPKYDKNLRTFFDTAVRQGRYYSEDWTFCENWRELGGKIYVDKRVQLRHSGHYTFSQESQTQLVNEIGPIYVEKLKADALAEYEKNKPQE
jgi:hypothetical protein